MHRKNFLNIPCKRKFNNSDCLSTYNSTCFEFDNCMYQHFEIEFVKVMKYFYFLFPDSNVFDQYLKNEFDTLSKNISISIPKTTTTLNNCSIFIAGGFTTYLKGFTTAFDDIDIFINKLKVKIDENFWILKSAGYIDSRYSMTVYDLNKEHSFIKYLTLKYNIKHFPQLISINIEFVLGVDCRIIRVLNSFDIPVCRNGISLIDKKKFNTSKILQYINFNNILVGTISLTTGEYFSEKLISKNRIKKYKQRSTWEYLKFDPPTLKAICYKHLHNIKEMQSIEFCLCRPSFFFTTAEICLAHKE